MYGCSNWTLDTRMLWSIRITGASLTYKVRSMFLPGSLSGTRWNRIANLVVPTIGIWNILISVPQWIRRRLTIVCTYQKLQCYTGGPKNQNLALPQTRIRINFAMAFVYDDEWICDRYSSTSDENHFDVCKSRDELDMQFEDEQKQNMKSKSLVHDVHELSCSVRWIFMLAMLAFDVG